MAFTRLPLLLVPVLVLLAVMPHIHSCHATFYDTDFGWYHLFTMDNINWEAATVGADVQCWFKGFQSQHDNLKEDRWWKYRRSCITHSGEQVTKASIPDQAYFQMNEWDLVLDWTATPGRTIYGMNSRNSEEKMDRLFQVKTVAMIPEFEYAGNCSTTAEVNNYDGPLDYTCPLAFQYIAGMSSVHLNTKEDRRWKYTCCSMAAKSCGSPAFFTSGTWGCNRQTVGGVCTHTCATGTRSTSASGTVTCQADKSWSSRTFQCNTINCGNPSNPTNGQFTCGSTTYQGTCSMSCNNGYQLSAAATITCSDYGSTFGWSSYSSSCNTITNYCPAPPTSITLGSVNCQPTTRSIGAVCTYSCDSGYVVDGTAQRVANVTCLASTASVGVWSRATPTCVLYAEHCPHTMAAPTNGAVSCDGYSLGGICTVSCNAGFRLRGYAPLATVDSVCKADTTWSRPETFYCDPIACPALSLGNGGLNCVGGTTAYNSQCTPYCNAGFTLEGDYIDAVRCNASQQWNATLADCRIVSCDPLTLENGAIDCTNGNTNYLSECTPSCNAGYTLGGANTNPVTCQASREWSATLQAECTIVSCDPLTLENGAVLCTNNNTNYGSECIPSCNPGYSLGGDYADVVECLATREWDRPMEAFCTLVSCNVLTLPHGTVNCTNNSTDFGSECMLSCNEGFQLADAGATGLRCTAAGNWNVSSVPQCAAINIETSSSATILPAVAGAVGGILVLLVLVVLLIIRRRRRQVARGLSEKDSTATISMHTMDSALSGYEPLAKSTAVQPTYDNQRPVQPSYDNQRPIPASVSADQHSVYEQIEKDHYSSPVLYESVELGLRASLVLGAKLGSGNFGVVLKGQLPRKFVPPDAQYLLAGVQGAYLDVAVKTMQPDATEKSRQEFVEEAQMMAQFSHPNVVRCITSLLDCAPFMSVLELMPYGDLRQVLWQSQKRNIGWTVAEMSHALAQIAGGLEYLESIRFVHRDIAARNCLVGTGLVVKISDFGLSRALAEEHNYYRMEARGKLPVKWMAPECLHYRKFSHSSDVWAFGVLAWEVFSYGAAPYGSKTGQQALADVEAGHRLAQPESCPNDLFALLRACWEIAPLSRPHIASLRAHFESAAAGHAIRDIGGLIA
ncbi:protein-tyrosine kinase HTK98 [Capsaspora owczarzaki ATCC 30864]|uniref:TKL protein kinase n=2 Tax=Capsaspora owczarzaki (strain ATCC 30864) TaxID=595528 RepID=A0A0D2VXE9_CAPO3|nr:protein-tyrosine kinase HTK98 [Capsaspora owczarzaki ATCC 30864]KJE96332.1 TKL protein kinase [Capsaspora owczarzaki ATCC 30864]|eukprot:XP_004344294.2 protein-tyrosine kinase HTK98 [Capsaspora owczarzaki ATCC 30864]